MPGTVRIANRHIAVEVSPLGAEMQSLTTSDGRSWLWDGDAAFWSGRSPVLFPIVGKAPGDRVTIEGRAHTMAQHGFARRSGFALVSSSDTRCRHELLPSEAISAVYPFAFRLQVEHALDGRVLTVAAEVFNDGDRSMPFGFGFHPAFRWPLPGAAGGAHSIRLDNGGEPALVRLDEGLVQPGPLPSPFHAGRLVLDHALFEEDAMIFPHGAGEGLSYEAEDGTALRFRFDNLPNLALWTKPGAPFICIEPWHGTAAEKGGSDALAERPFTTLLPPGKAARFAFSVELPA